MVLDSDSWFFTRWSSPRTHHNYLGIRKSLLSKLKGCAVFPFCIQVHVLHWLFIVDHRPWPWFRDTIYTGYLITYLTIIILFSSVTKLQRCLWVDFFRFLQVFVRWHNPLILKQLSFIRSFYKLSWTWPIKVPLTDISGYTKNFVYPVRRHWGLSYMLCW